MRKSRSSNESTDNSKLFATQFEAIHHKPIQHKSQLDNNNVRVFSTISICSESQKAEIVNNKIPIDDNNVYVQDVNRLTENSVLESPKQRPISIDSSDMLLCLTPEKLRISSSTQELSPILESCFTKCWNKSKIIASTPANSCPDRKSPERINTDILDVLDRLCSPVVKKQSLEILNCSLPHEDSIQTQNHDVHCGKPVKRLFDNTSDNTTSYCQSKRQKCEENGKCNKEYDSFDEPLDPFKEHDISERTLMAICEGTNHLVNITHEEQPKFNLQNNETSSKELESSYVHCNQTPVIGVNKTELDYSKKIGLNSDELPITVNKSSATVSYESNDYKNYLLYTSAVKASVKPSSSKVELNDLLVNAKVLEHANRLPIHNSKNNKLYELQNKVNIPHQQGFVRVEQITSDDQLGVKETNKQLYSESKDANLQKDLANDSIGITDTQFCEVVEAAEIITDINNSLKECNKISPSLSKVTLKSKISNQQSSGINDNNTDMSTNIYGGYVSKTRHDQTLSKKRSPYHSTCIKSKLSDEFSKHTKHLNIGQCDAETIVHKQLDAPKDNNVEFHKQKLDREKQCLKRVPSKSHKYSELSTHVTQQSIIEESSSVEFPQPLRGFSTASGKFVSVSDESLKKAKELLIDDNILAQKNSTNLNIECKSNVSCNSNLKLGGFENFEATAPQSEKSINKSRRSFDNKYYETFVVGSKPSETLRGFSTASGKVVGVSEKSLIKAKQLLDECSSVESPIDEMKLSHISETNSDNKNLISEFKHCLPSSKDLLMGSKQDVSCISMFKTPINLKEDDPVNFKTRHIDDKIKSKPVSMGFHTAGGKSVNISASSFKAAKQLFSEDFSDDKTLRTLESLTSTNMDSSENVNILYKKEDLDILDKHSNLNPSMFQGFNTANGKSVSVSRKSLNKARQLFLEDTNTDQVKENLEGRNNGFCISLLDASMLAKDEIIEGSTLKSPDKLNKPFCTAGGSKVEVSDDSLEKVRSLFNQNSSICNAKQLKNVDQLCDLKIPNFEGFNTASGKSVSVSSESLNKARQLFVQESNTNQINANFKQQYDETCTNFLVKEEIIDDYMLKLPDKVIKGFCTASGSKVEVSDDSLKKVRSLCNEKSAIHNAKQLQNVNQFCDLKTPNFEGFNTASGKCVSVSSESLNKARQLFVQESNTDQINDNFKLENDKTFTNLFAKDQIVDDYRPKVPDKIIKGFCTAGGSKVEVSNDSLNIVRSLFNENSAIHNDRENIETSHDLKATFEGFNTASAKSVGVSKSSISKARQLFSEELSTEKIQDDLVSINNEKSIYSLERHILTNDKIIDRNVMELSPKPMKGFHTAGGCKVNVLDDSLNKVRSLLNEKTPGYNVSREEKRSEIIAEQRCEGKVKFLREETQLNGSSKKKQLRQNEQVMLSEQGKISKHKTDGCDKSYSSADLNKTSYCAIKSTYKQQENSAHVVEDIQNHESTNIHTGSLKHNIPSNFQPSVISEGDLSLLNRSLCNSLQNITPLKKSGKETNDSRFLSTIIDQEVSESMAALVADEESSSPFSKRCNLKPIITTPAMIFDRPNRLPSITTYENNMQVTNDLELSPVLDSASYFNPTKGLKKKLFESDSIKVCDNLMQATVASKTPGFKPPYVTSTPKESFKNTNIKHSLEFGDILPSIKRSKTELEYQELTTNQTTSLAVKDSRSKAAAAQEKLVLNKNKSSNKIKPSKGLYLLRKQTEKSRTLKSLVDGTSLYKRSTEELLRTGVSQDVLKISASSAKDFKFSAFHYFSEETAKNNVDGVPVGDGALLVLDADGCAGVAEFTRAFQASPAVDPSLVEPSWVANHYRWIILKLASTERMLPELFANRCLTPNNVMLQLKYRYDRELDRCERPVLRKILERDETPARTMVLFVAEIINVQGTEYGARKELELSDGWYCVRTSVDSEMENLINRKKVEVGTKLVICGAELVGNEDGCNPLETPPGVRLKVSTNSCRRARWFARLGLLPCPPPPLALLAVMPRGGAIHQLTATIARVYPLLFREKLPDGQSVVRSERAEQAVSDAYQTKRQQCAETILIGLQADMETSRSRTSSKSLIGADDDMESLNSQQRLLIQEQNFEESSRIQQELQDKLAKKLDEKLPQRVVTRMLKVRLVSGSEEWGESCRSALLTVWNPSDEVISLLGEGNSLVFHHLTASGYSRFGDLQLTGGRSTRYHVTSRSPVPRTVTSLSCLRDSAFAPLFSEVDLVGLVLQVGDTSIADGKTVYIADASSNFLCVSFSSEIKETGYKSVLSAGCLVAISCLHWRSHLVSWSLPTAFASEITTFTQNPRQPHLQKALAKLRQLTRAMNVKSYMEDCTERVEGLIKQRNSGGLSSTNFKPENSVANSSASNSRHLEQQNTSKMDSSDCSRTLCDSFDSSGTPKNKRLLLLERFGEPPPISPLPTNTPQRLKQHFRPPLRKPFSENKPR